MNNDEARFILSAYRPGGDDAGDAHFAEAIGQAERDPALAEWFAGARQFDAAMSEALGTIPIPPELRANILAGGKISRPQWGATRRTFLALAAGIVLLAALAGIWLQRAPGLERWQQDALAAIPRLGSETLPFDLENKDAAVLQRWLQAQNAPVPVALPQPLRPLPALGCKMIDFDGRPVSIICFKMESGKLVHLVTTEPGSSGRGLTAAPRFVDEGGWRTASWRAEGRDQMLATKASEAELRATLAGVKATAQRASRRDLFFAIRP